jgi:hypothetical protein
MKQKKTRILISINALQQMLEWSSRVGSDEIAEVEFVINTLKNYLDE